jgi:energy-coupling factor transporter ATP-binding protein EcfA2
MSIQDEVIAWLHSRADWQQEATTRILKSGKLSDSDLDELTTLCKIESDQEITNTRTFPGLSVSIPSPNQLKLTAIGDIQGIDNLAPRNPLKFGDGNLTVVYGNNGSGKSGYTRILKKVCGKTHAVELRSNVFEWPSEKSCCKIEYSRGGDSFEQDWDSNDGVIADLSGVDIFDSVCGKLYLSKENEVSYTPMIVALFDELVRACGEVKKRLQHEQDMMPSILPTLPFQFLSTQVARTYRGLNYSQTEDGLKSILKWSEEDGQQLDGVEQQLKTKNFGKLAIHKYAQKKQVDTIVSELTTALSNLSKSKCDQFIVLQKEAVRCRAIAQDGAKVAFQTSIFEGVGEDTWKALWEAARHYSESVAYKNYDFPYVEDGAKCILCHQKLQPDAQVRMKSFEGFVVGELEANAKEAEGKVQIALDELPICPNEDTIKTTLQAAGLEINAWYPHLSGAWADIAKQSGALISKSDDEHIGMNVSLFPWIEELKRISQTLEREAQKCDKNAATFNRLGAVQKKTQLLAKKWTTQQKESIKQEIERLKKVNQINEWIRGTNHTGISRFAGVIAEKVITDDYINRFNNELSCLGAKRIKVELVKTRTDRGKALHRIRLKGAITGAELLDVLSDGERRVVELAAFLADVIGKTEKSPFVFDDPISSLDQDFEGKTIERLIALSADRQVLVFTHRLNFLGILSDKASPEIICIRNESWGAGEPGDVPIFAKKPEKALSKLRDECLARAEKALNVEGYELYYPLAKAICSDLRILLERIVELDFLADVVQRHRKEVHTKGKIRGLAKITIDDCALIDGYMTKYSCYEHSQSSEAPVDVPEPEELRQDINTLLEWHDEFKKRLLPDVVS